MKGERVAQLELLLLSHPEGLRRADIARRLGVHRSTVGRYVDELKQYIDVYDDNNLIKLKKSEPEDESVEQLSLYESLAFNLSAEALASRPELVNPHLASGLRKIAVSMRRYSPGVADNILSVADQIDRAVRKNGTAAQHTAVLEVLIDGWVSGRMVRIKHYSDGIVEETELAPYFIGFKGDDDSRSPISVTGRLRHTTEIVTIEIKKIIEAVILKETYTIPDNLKPFRRPETNSRYPSTDMIPLTLRIKEKSAMNSFRGLDMSTPEFSTDASGNTICKVNCENSIDLMLAIIKSGESIEVLAPESYRKMLCRNLRRILSLYEPVLR